MAQVVTIAVTISSLAEDIPQLLHDTQKVGVTIGGVEFETDNFSWDVK
jgi:hypothetical protein